MYRSGCPPAAYKKGCVEFTRTVCGGGGFVSILLEVVNNHESSTNVKHGKVRSMRWCAGVSHRNTSVAANGLAIPWPGRRR